MVGTSSHNSYARDVGVGVQGYGTTELNGGSVPTEDSIYRIGSVTKVCSGIACLCSRVC